MSVTADFFFPEMNKLQGPGRVQRKDMLAFLGKMKRVASVNMRLSSEAARGAYVIAAAKGEKFLDKNPAIAAEVTPLSDTSLLYIPDFPSRSIPIM